MNLSNQQSEDKEGKSKIIIFGLINTIAAFGLGYSIYLFFQDFNLAPFIVLLVATVIFSAISIFNYITVEEREEQYAIVLLEALAILFYSSKISFLWAIIGSGSFLVFSIPAIEAARRYRSNLIKMNFWSNVSHNLKNKMTVISLLITMITIGYGLSNSEKLGKLIVDSSIDSSKIILNHYVPGISSVSRVDEIISEIAKKKVGNNSQVIAQAITQVKSYVMTDFGINITGKETIFDLLNNIVTQKTKNVSPLFKKIGLVALALLLFLSIKGIALLLTWFIVPLAYVIFKLMLSLKFIRYKYETIDKEYISF